jgi:AcrR family transcriptional regulator
MLILRGIRFADPTVEFSFGTRDDRGRLKVERHRNPVERPDRNVLLVVQVPSQRAAIELASTSQLVDGESLPFALGPDDSHNRPRERGASGIHAKYFTRPESSIVIPHSGLYYSGMGTDESTERRTRQARSQRTHERLLHAAAVEFERFGYENSSMARLSKEAGVTTGATYNHFPSKWAIAEEILGRQQRRVREVAADVKATLPGAFERLLCFSADLSELLTQDPGVRASVQLSMEPALPVASSAWREWAELANELAATASDGADKLRVTDQLGSVTISLIVSAWLLTRDQDEAALDTLLQPLWNALVTGIVRSDRKASALASVETIFGR